MDFIKVQESESDVDQEKKTSCSYNLRNRKSKSKPTTMTKRKLWNEDNIIMNVNNSDNDLHSQSELSDDSDDSEYTTSDENEEVDMQEYRKFLYKLFPSSYLKNKIKTNEDESEISQKKKHRNFKKSKKGKIKEYIEEDDEEEDDDDENEEDIESSDDESEYEEEEKEIPFNIVLRIDNHQEPTDDTDEEDDDDDDEDEDEDEDENEKTNKKKKQKVDHNIDTGDTEELLTLLKAMKNKNNDDDTGKAHEKLISKYETILEQQKKADKEKQLKKEKKVRKKHQKRFLKSLKDNNNLDDLAYFKKQSVEYQKNLLEMMENIKNESSCIVPHRIKLIESNIPASYKQIALRKIDTLKNMDPCSGEYFKIKYWVDNFMTIPFNQYRTLDIQVEDGIEKLNDFMINAKKTLDAAVYGLDDAKMQILQMLAQFISNPTSVGSSIAIQGPMGTGKTTLVKEGISKILDRPFEFIALGGATDSSFLEGHSYTYEGSTWGHIVEILKQSKCMNPVIYFDELDKVSETQKGEEIIGILTHLTDTSQNNQFHDKYFGGIDFDLSKCLFIFSYNDESKVNPILRDRMYKIQTNGYSPLEKKIIAKDYLIPKIETNIGFKKSDIIFNDMLIEHIIENYASEEKGVRTLKRCIETIFTKLNLFRMLTPGTKIYGNIASEDVSFPHTVSKEQIGKLLKKDTSKEWIRSIYV